ncbi:MAG: helix-turn-helix transcriptional regulator [Mycobacteriales bacterium]
MPQSSRTEEEKRLLRDFGYRVRTLRAERGMTQMKLADAANLHVTYIGQVENGLRNVAVLNLYALASALGTTPGDLLPPAKKRRGRPSA